MYELNEMLEEYLITLKAEGKVDITIKACRKHIEPFFAYLYSDKWQGRKNRPSGGHKAPNTQIHHLYA
ncbi:hypothetical protein GM60_05440 [Listeria monocytogenes]|nr:hypothetical protein [Listeria monocytogenes]MCJ45477.1 hypothetical protein [Listeria monocytogenes]